MSVVKHRIVAGTLLLAASLGLVAFGRTMVQDSAEVAAVRHHLEGKWRATRVEVAQTVKLEGVAAAETVAEFSDRQVRFIHLINSPKAEGVYHLIPDGNLGKIDLKLDGGWILGIYRLEGDKLTLCLNAPRLPEQLGVPALGRPEKIHSSGGRFVYAFRKVFD